MKLLHLFVFFVLIVKPVFSQFPVQRFEKISTEQGLSNSRVYTILQDRKGFLWFGTLDGLNRYDGYTFKIYKNIPGDSISIHNNRVTLLYEDSYGLIWIATKNDGVSKFDPEKEKFTHYQNIPGDPTSIPFNQIDNFFEDEEGKLWFLNASTGFVYDRKNEVFIYHDKVPEIENKYSAGYIQQIVKSKTGISISVQDTLFDDSGDIWVGTKQNSLFRISLHEAEHVVTRFVNAPFNQKTEIKSIIKDRSGIIWIGTNNDGVIKYNPLTEYFSYYNKFTNQSTNLEEFTVRAICEDKQGDIWIGTYNKGLIKYDRKQLNFLHFTNNPNDINSISNDKIRTIFTDSKGIVWVGSYGGLSRYDSNNQTFENYTITNKTSENRLGINKFLYDNRVYNITEDFFGNLWIANWEALTKFNRKTETFTHFPKEKFGLDNIRTVIVDENNILWIGAEFGGMIKYNIINDKYIKYSPEEPNNRLIHQNVFCIQPDEKGNLWVSTFNGLNKINRETGQIQYYTEKDGLASNMIYGILEDRSNNLWLTTSNGLSRLNPGSGEIINYYKKSGLQDNEFTEEAFYKSQITGEMMVGGINGFNIFYPDSIKVNHLKPEVALINLKVLNRDVNRGERINNKIILEKLIEYTENLVLSYKDKIITFEFAAFHYAIPEKILYAYKMEGFDDDWIYTGASRRYATYTNLNPGKYTFKVKARNSDLIWNEQGIRLDIQISPPVLKTWYAYTLYALVIVLLLILFRRYSLKSMKLKNELKFERIKKEKAAELNRVKLTFFMNISHEFRSPLTLILGPLRKILASDPSEKVGTLSSQFKIMQRNANRLLDLINQILDLRKFETGNMQLQAEETNIVEYTRNLTIQYEEMMIQNKIDFSFFSEFDDKQVWIDKDKYGKIIQNLLSNAIKFTSENGKIQVKISTGTKSELGYNFKVGNTTSAKFVEITVEDTGIGIPSEVVHKIFKRFYQVESTSIDMQGTGIGLALTKDMVELHKAEILVSSHEGRGSKFTVRLPEGNEHLKDEEMIDSTENEKGAPNENMIKAIDFPMLRDTETSNAKTENNNKRTILVIDDNEDIRYYIKDNLISEFNILMAENGSQGYELAIKEIPDLIISDIMMPVMDGIELCSKVKSNVNICHIPVVLLTAKATDVNKVEGLKVGADDYITKPFNNDVLEARVKNLIQSRVKLQQIYSKNIVEDSFISENGLDKLNPLDKKLLDKAISAIENNLTNVDFNVEMLSQTIGMSRSNLHIKLRALTNQSATEFIRTIRLRNALRLLKDNHMNVVEISYEVGFNTPSYFIKCFKKQFGITPKEYMNS